MRTLHLFRSLAVVSVALLASITAPAQSIGIGVSVNIAPPMLPVYAQPAVPGPGFLWAPGYWAWASEGYYWVPGSWVRAPRRGFLWTPGYWAFERDAYFWHGGYWGPHVGFYGGVNYGFGYFGAGYAGGYWNNGAFFYNRACNTIGTTSIVNVYNKTVINNISPTRVSFNGGSGTTARPTGTQLLAARESHLQPLPGQLPFKQRAASNRAFLATANHGAPTPTAVARLGQFSNRGSARANANRVNRPSGFNGAGTDRPPTHSNPPPQGQAERGARRP